MFEKIVAQNCTKKIFFKFFIKTLANVCALVYNIDTLGKRLHLASVSSLFLFLEEEYETHTS